MKWVGLTFDIVLSNIVTWAISWIVIALIIYIAARLVVGEEASFKASLALTLLGVLVVGFSFQMGKGFFGPLAGLIIAALLWICLTKVVFHISWLHALAISILAVVIDALLALTVTLMLRIALPVLLPTALLPF